MKFLKSTKKILLLSFGINILFICFGGIYFYKTDGINVIKNFVVSKLGNQSLVPSFPYYYDKNSLFEVMPVTGGIVFLGDSLTDNNEWNEMFNSIDIYNRGIQGDTTDGVVERIGQVTEGKPKKIFLMIGHNDLLRGNNAENIDNLVNNYSKIIETIKKDSPNTEVYIQSILPVNNELFGDEIENSDINAVNERLKKLEKDNVKYVDLYSLFVKDNQLNSKYTNDGVHLTGDGYMLWKKAIEQYVK